MTEKKHIQSKEAQEALDSINAMQRAGLKRLLPTSRWLGAILGIIIGTQIALLGSEIRTYNTILIVLIAIMAVAIVSKNQSAGVTEKIMLSKRTVIIGLICIIPLYFLAIISSQYLTNHLAYTWAPAVIGTIFTLGIWGLIASEHRTYNNKFKEGAS